jgi:hypothetical protein
MSLPTPDDLGRAPAWENYVVAQTVQASRGQIPLHALAFGVEISGRRLHLHFQFSKVTPDDEDDMNDIVSELEALVGGEIEVAYSYETLETRQISKHNGVSWIFLARA